MLNMLSAFRFNKLCFVLGLGVSISLLLFQALWVHHNVKLQLTPKRRAIDDKIQYTLNKLTKSLDSLNALNLKDKLEQLERLTNALNSQDTAIQSMARILSEMLRKMDGLLQRDLDRGQPELEKDKQRSEYCEIPNDSAFPFCSGKAEWMRAHWQADPCYNFYGVDGTTCSILIYLSEREHFCPVLVWRNSTAASAQPKGEEKRVANVQRSFNALYHLIDQPRPSINFIRIRIKRLAERWSRAAEVIGQKYYQTPQYQKKILLYPGVMSGKVGEMTNSLVGRGGPLGELVQWADIIATLYILGHNVKIAFSLVELQSLIGTPPGKGNCPILRPLPFDLVYMDYHGLGQLYGHMGISFEEYKCRFRVIDSFGTEPYFNHRNYANLHGFRTIWGSWNLQPQQYMTMFPHTPDNSFMGFVSEELDEAEKRETKAQKGQNLAVVYGKQDYMWQDMDDYLETINKVMEIHGTVYDDPERETRIPSFVINHGVLSQDNLQQLLKKAKLFVGMGFPYEGPAPLEAIAHGCVFIQPRFTPAHSSRNNAFYNGKPTLREVRSQHPYTEEYIGMPHVWTVNITNATEVLEAVNSALAVEVEPYTPYEFTCEGMLERVFAYITHQVTVSSPILHVKDSMMILEEKNVFFPVSWPTIIQDFCNDSPPVWPPHSAAVLHMGQDNESCVKVCQRAALICEPAFFYYINSIKTFSNLGLTCNRTLTSVNHLFPAYEATRKQCYLASDHLYSCAGSLAKYRRLCPCRNYREGQTALCKECL